MKLNIIYAITFAGAAIAKPVSQDLVKRQNSCPAVLCCQTSTNTTGLNVGALVSQLLSSLQKILPITLPALTGASGNPLTSLSNVGNGNYAGANCVNLPLGTAATCSGTSVPLCCSNSINLSFIPSLIALIPGSSADSGVIAVGCNVISSPT